MPYRLWTMFRLNDLRLTTFMTSREKPRKLLVTGATGRTGSRIVDRLAARGVAYRAGSRSGDPRFDWHDRLSWPAALNGIDAVYLCYAPDLAAPGAAELIGEFTAAAAAAGVRHAVLLTGRGEAGAERAIKAVQSNISEWTILQASWFAQNFSEHVLLGPIQRGRLLLPAGEVHEPTIDLDDFADAAVNVLTEDGHAGRTYELTGPESLSFAQMAQRLSAATGREISYHASDVAEFVADLAIAGMPAEDAVPLAEMLSSIFDGRNAEVSEDLAAILGRPTRSFAEYANAAASTGLWHASDPAGV